MIEQRTQTYEFAATFRCVVVSNDFGTIEAYANARAKKLRCQTNDTWIIASARQHQATLDTEDDDMARLARTMNVETVLCTCAQPGVDNAAATHREGLHGRRVHDQSARGLRSEPLMQCRTSYAPPFPSWTVVAHCLVAWTTRPGSGHHTMS